MATKEEILDSISELTVLELKELLDAFEERFGGGPTLSPPPEACTRRSRNSRSYFAAPLSGSRSIALRNWSIVRARMTTTD